MQAIQDFSSRIDRVNKQLLETKEKKTEYVATVTESKQGLLDKIREIRSDINTHLDRLEEKAVSDLNTTEAELQKEIESDFETLDKHVVQLNMLKESLDDSSKQNDVQEMINKAKTFINNSTRTAIRSLKLVPNSEFISSIQESTNLVSFDFNLVEEKQVRVKLEAWQFNEKCVDNCRRDYPRYISGICQLVDNTYVLADTNNNELIQVDQNFETINALALEDGPYGMCLIDVDELAVRMCNKTIQMVETGSVLSLKKKIYIGETPFSCGFTYRNGMFWSSGYHGVNLYKKNGDFVKSISNDINGIKPFLKGQPEDIAVSKDGAEYFVTDSKNGVLVFSNTGSYRMSLKDDRLWQTKGVAVTDDGLVIVAGFNSRNIVAFNPDLNTSNVLVTTKGMPGYPVSLHYDGKQNRLLVGCNNSKVLVLEMKK